MRYEVLVDRSEPANKCSILPLAGREDLVLRRFERSGPIAALEGQLLLHPGGEDILAWAARTGGARQGPGGPPAADSGRARGPGEAGDLVISAIDCHWRRLDAVVARIEGPLPPLVRLPDAVVTAYPRRNQQGLDPTAGLATVEALFAAAALLGHRDESLFARYAPGAAFLAANPGILGSAGPAHPPLVKVGGDV